MFPVHQAKDASVVVQECRGRWPLRGLLEGLWGAESSSKPPFRGNAGWGWNACALLEDAANQNPLWHNGGHVELTARVPGAGVRGPAVRSSSRGALSSWYQEPLLSRVPWSCLLGCCTCESLWGPYHLELAVNLPWVRHCWVVVSWPVCLSSHILCSLFLGCL